MVDRSAGSASIRIKPDATRFVADLKRDLASKQAEFVMRVSADTGQARADIDRFRQVQQRNGIGLGVDVALGQAQADLAAFRARQRADGMVIKVDADTGGARREFREIDKHLESFRRSDLLRLNVGAGLLAGIGPALTGLAQVAAAIQQIAQAGLALPGVFAGATASIGTLVVGLSGIADAYSAVSDAASSAGQDQVAQARAATAAQNSLRNSNVDLENAYGDLARATRDARQELTDLRVEQRGGMIDESRAILEAQKAREDIMSGNYSDIRDAVLRVEEADQRLLEVRNRNAQTAAKLNEANAKGIAGNDAVVAANERVVRSQQQVADAQAAVADTGSQMSAAQKKAADEMAKLGPNAQALVNTLVELTPAWQEVQQAISQPLLEGKAEEFKSFFTTMRPLVETGGANIAKAWNRNITALFDSVGSDEGKGLIDRILGNTADAQGRLSKAIDPLVKGVGTLVAAGTDVLPRLADGLTGVLERFRDFITEADQDGSLDQWINDGIDGLASVGESVLNIGKSFTAITSAAGGGGSFLNWLQDATGRLQTFLNSAEGQEQLKKFFKESSDFYHNTLRPVLEDIPGLLKGIHDGAVTYIGGLMTTISPLTEFLKEHPGLVQGAVAAYAAWKTIDGVTSLMDNLKSLNTMLGVTLPDSASKGASKMSMALGPVAALAAMIVAVDPEKQLTDDGSLLNGPKNGNWGEVAFGDAWPWIKEKLNIGGGKAEADRRAEEQRQQHQGDTTGPYAPPQFSGTPLNEELRAKIAAGQLPGYSLAPDGAIIGPDGKPLPAFKTGGPTPSGGGPGPTGGWLAEIHSDEWVLPRHARKAVGDAALWKLTQGRSFEQGGYIDEHGNPITPGPAPGPSAPIIAANPTGNSGGISGIFGQIASGIQGPINNVTNVIGSLSQASPGGAHGAPAGPAAPGAIPGISAATNPVASFGTNLLSGIVPGLNIGGGSGAAAGGGQQLLPGLAGLFQAGGNQGLQQQWLSQTGNWLANWGANTLLQFGSTLLNGALGFFGAEGLMQSPILQGIGATVGHFGSVAGQLGGAQATGGLSPGTVLGAGGGTITLLDANGTPITIDAAGAHGGTGAPAKGGWGSVPINPGQITSLPTRLGQEGNLQINTINVKRAIENAFPQIQKIGGYRSDALKWHPNGLAIDVMIPGAGGLNDPTPPEGLALGNQIYQYVMANKEKFGVDYILWQEKDHYNHLHINTTGGGYPDSSAAPGNPGPITAAIPGMFSGGPTPGPASRPIPAILHGNEFVISSRGRSRVPDSFLHALNTGIVDPQSLPQFAAGGVVAPPVGVPQPPLPPLPRVPDAKQIIPPPSPRPRPQPSTPPPVATPQPAPTQAPPVAAPPSQQPQQPGWTPPAGIVAAPSGIDHTLPWVNQAIMSGASVAANIASTAIQAAAAAGSMGASAAGGGMGAGAAGSLVAGGIMQAGKVATKVANVISSSLVGSVPGSFTDTPSGQVMRAEQNRPSLAEYRGGNTYQVTGYDPQVISREIQTHEALDRQARLANIPVRR